MDKTPKDCYMAHLPASAREIADVIGEEKALELIGKLPVFWVGGPHSSRRAMLYVPRTLRADHPLVRMIGWAHADKLVKAFGGEVLKPATCADVYRRFRDRSIVELAMAGMSYDELADIMGVGVRHIRNVMREIPQVVFGKSFHEHAQSPELETA